MQLLRHAHEVLAFVEKYSQDNVTALIQLRMAELVDESGTCMEELVFFVILEPEDTIAELQRVLGTDLIASEGHPLWEIIEAHAMCFEMVFVLASSGYGALVMVPEQSAHPDLLALCRVHAEKRSGGKAP